MENLGPVRIFACEPQPIVVEGLERVLATAPDLSFAGSRQTVSDALDAVRTVDPDIVLIDQGAGLKTALQLISDLRLLAPRIRPILWTHDLAEVESFRVLQMGARGVLRKNTPVSTLIECLRSVGAGNVWIENPPVPASEFPSRRVAPRLTPREREIVHYVCRGLKNKEIAESLSITPGTVKVHLMHIFEKTGVKDRFELAIHGRKLGGEFEEESLRVTAAS